MPIGWGILGSGMHADRFITPALLSESGSRLIAICDNEEGKAEGFARRHGIKTFYHSFDKMLENPEIQAVWICTPNHLHAQQTMMAAEAGRHVLCEKPMALSEADAESMLNACLRNHVQLGIDFQNRLHPAHIEARRLIQNGNVGDITVARAEYCRGFPKGFKKKGWRADPNRAGAGALMSQGLHPIDLLRYLLDSEVVEVLAMTDEHAPDRPVEDMAYVMLRFKNDARGIVICGGLAPWPNNDVVIYGSESKITAKGTVGMWHAGELLLEGNQMKASITFPHEDEDGTALYKRVAEAFNGSITEKSESIISGTNGLQMVRITEAILQSTREGKAIKINNS